MYDGFYNLNFLFAQHPKKKGFLKVCLYSLKNVRP